MKASKIADFLGEKIIGPDVEVTGHGSLNNWSKGDIVFVKIPNQKNLELLSQCEGVLALVPQDMEEDVPITHIHVVNPRLAFIKVVSEFFSNPEIPIGIHPTAVVENGASIGNNVTIGAHCYIGANVTIGDGTIIFPNVTIYNYVEIGKNCYIKPGVVIGGPGFGFEYDENKVPIQFPHTGRVVIGNNVYIGANTTVSRATIDNTIIEDNVKIDDLCLIAHNCHVHKNTLIIGRQGLGGGVEVGENCWVAGSTIQKIKIGDNATVGAGSMVLRDVKPGVTVFGIPATKVKF